MKFERSVLVSDYCFAHLSMLVSRSVYRQMVDDLHRPGSAVFTAEIRSYALDTLWRRAEKLDNVLCKV